MLDKTRSLARVGRNTVPMTAILTVQNVEKSFGTRHVLRGVSFAVHDEDRIGLVGVNGSGKSTLLRMLVGGAPGDRDVDADAGLITRKRGLKLEYLPQEPKLPPDAQVIDLLRGRDEEHEIRGLAAA